VAKVSGDRVCRVLSGSLSEVRIEGGSVPQLPTKAPFSKDFEEAVGLACESAAARQITRQFQLSASTVRAIDRRYLQRWAKSRKNPFCGRWESTRFIWARRRSFSPW